MGRRAPDKAVAGPRAVPSRAAAVGLAAAAPMHHHRPADHLRQLFSWATCTKACHELCTRLAKSRYGQYTAGTPAASATAGGPPPRPRRRCRAASSQDRRRLYPAGTATSSVELWRARATPSARRPYHAPPDPHPCQESRSFQDNSAPPSDLTNQHSCCQGFCTQKQSADLHKRDIFPIFGDERESLPRLPYIW
jgi:hypothetical protein